MAYRQRTVLDLLVASVLFIVVCSALFWTITNYVGRRTEENCINNAVGICKNSCKGE